MRLNRLLVLTLLLFATSIAGRAQCPSNQGQLEFADSYGFGAAQQVFPTTNSVTHTLPGNKINTENGGVWFNSIRYFMSRAVAVGITYGVTTIKGQYTDVFNSAVAGNYKITYNTVAIEFYYIYTFHKYIETYSTLGFGPTFINVATTDANKPSASYDRFSVHYAPLGVRVGGRIAAFAEVGIGYKGLINIGISSKIGRSCWWRDRY
jgi:hypothetical protein